MRFILLLLPVFFASCAIPASHREVLDRARTEVSLREPWSDKALVVVEKKPAFAWSVWQIRAGELDYSTYPTYEGLQVVPGSERQIYFARNGCLLAYTCRTTRCNSRYATAPAPRESAPDSQWDK